MSESREYMRKVRSLASEFNQRNLIIKSEPGSDAYNRLIDYFNNKWNLFCRQNNNRSLKPDAEGFKNYMKLCQ
jgi:hypothetical protein